MQSFRLPEGRGRGGTLIPPSDTPAPPTAAISTTALLSVTDEISNVALSSATSISTPEGPRGRGGQLKKKMIEDPRWTVSTLTINDFRSNTRPVKPKEIGRIGEEIQVMVNYFPILQYPQKGLVYRYNIQICNKRRSEIHRDQIRGLYNAWLNKFCKENPQFDRYSIVFDNQTIVIVFNQPLPNIDENGRTILIDGPSLSNPMEEYTFTIKPVGDPIDFDFLRSSDAFLTDTLTKPKSTDLLNIKQVLTIALHEHCSSHADFVCNRSFFIQPTSENRYGQWDLGMGKALWRGFYSCLIFASGTYKLLANLDVSHSIFMKKQPFLEFLCEVMLHSPCGKHKYRRERDRRKADGVDVLFFLDREKNRAYYDGEVEFLLRHCKHLRVRSQDPVKPVVYYIQALGEAPSREMFEWKHHGNRLISVMDYYKEQYELELQYPSLPVLRMRNKSCVPMELVNIEPVKVKKITDEQRALLCRYSSLKPLERRQAIEQVRHNPKQQCFEDDPFVKAWNLNVDVKMIIVPARILPMPTIVYTEEYVVTAERVRQPGVWDSGDARFYKPTDFPHVWAMINLSSLLNQGMCEAFYNELSTVARRRGINCSPPSIFEGYNLSRRSMDEIVQTLTQMMHNNQDCQFFLVILPDDSKETKQAYGDLKKACELELGFGIVSQMIKPKNAMIGTKKDKTKWDYGKLNNILLKINSKLNGINSILQVHDVIERFFARGHRIMYVGADLSHAAPGMGSRRSVVAVVASADDVLNRYFKEVYMQDRPPQARGESRESIVDMKDIMKSLIQQYDQHRGFPPTAIVIYRDGISISEFDSVFENELTAIRNACAELSPAYRPYLTYVVVNKQHQTRFFPTDSNANVLAGTVVDSPDVTNATTYDFFLNSHHGPLGTSRPTHYHVLYDDNKLKPDEVQMLTYALCYTYARCTRSVSIPAPVKYADLLATRASYYLNIDDEWDAPCITTDQDVEVPNTTVGKRIVLSPKLALDCPFFL